MDGCLPTRWRGGVLSHLRVEMKAPKALSSLLRCLPHATGRLRAHFEIAPRPTRSLVQYTLHLTNYSSLPLLPLSLLLSSRHASKAASESQSRTKSLAKSGGLSEPDTPKGRRKADTLPCDKTASGCVGCCLSSLVTGYFHVRLVARVRDWTSSGRRQVLHTMTNHMLQSKSRVKTPESIAPLHSFLMSFLWNIKPHVKSYSHGSFPQWVLEK